MKKTLLVISVLAGQVALAQTPITIGRTEHVPVHMSASRGTDTLFAQGFLTSLAAEQVSIYGTPGGGNLLGNSEYPITQFAQQFHVENGAVVDEIMFYFGAAVSVTGDANSKVTAHVFSFTGTTGTTGSVTGTVPCPGGSLAQADIPVSAVTTQNFTTTAIGPVTVAADFAVGFDITQIMSGDSVNLAASTANTVEVGDHSWLLLQGNWATVRAATQGQADLDLAIGVVLTPGSTNVGENAWFNSMQLNVFDSRLNAGALHFSYATKEAGNNSLRLIDGMGRPVAQQGLGVRAAGTYTEALSTEGLAAGAYYLSLITNGQAITKKVVLY